MREHNKKFNSLAELHTCRLLRIIDHEPARLIES
jgi:hypothetical protein